MPYDIWIKILALTSVDLDFDTPIDTDNAALANSVASVRADGHGLQSGAFKPTAGPDSKVAQHGVLSRVFPWKGISSIHTGRM